MAAPWRDHPSWTVIARAEAALGETLVDLVLDAPRERLTRTREAQLAVLLTSLVAWDALARTDMQTPVAFAGHSLGQVSALIAAGVLGFEAGVRFAARRAELTQAAADAHPGRMAALLGVSVDDAEAACATAPNACWVANDNAPGQVVIAGTADGVEAATAFAKEHGARRARVLDVGGAFHTPLMRDATTGLADGVVRDLPLRAPSAPIVSNDDAQPYTDADGWRERLPRHVSVPVRWRPAMETIAGLGATSCLEVGHGSMLAALAKRTTPDLPVRGVSTPADLTQISEPTEVH